MKTLTSKELQDKIDAAKRAYDDAKKNRDRLWYLAGNKWEAIASKKYNEYAALYNSVPGNIQILLGKAKHNISRPYKKGGATR